MKASKYLFVFSLWTISFLGSAQESKHLNLKDSLALDGYDLLSYFNSDTPVKGSEEFKFSYEAATYYFANKKNLEDFKNNPTKYKVVYGGWCANAMGENGDKVEVDPLTYKIKDGKLYLFYNKYFTNTLTKWEENEVELEKNANQNWQNLIQPK
tara:strand:+ start:183 stop:644 length:462 start_codon:yes stop_codon:yes gene_type:complete